MGQSYMHPPREGWMRVEPESEGELCKVGYGDDDERTADEGSSTPLPHPRRRVLYKKLIDQKVCHTGQSISSRMGTRNGVRRDLSDPAQLRLDRLSFVTSPRKNGDGR